MVIGTAAAATRRGSNTGDSGAGSLRAQIAGAPGGGWTLLTTANLTAPVNWTTNRTGTFDAQGNLTLTNGILSTERG